MQRRTFLAGAATALAPKHALAQPGQGLSVLGQEGRYLPFWLESRDQTQGGAQQVNSFVGDEARALANAFSRDLFMQHPPAADAEAFDAIDHIVAAAVDRRVVMLNEAHVASRHRSFLAQVLRALRPLGFTHLACETFLHTRDDGAPDVRMLRAGEPFNPAMGYYTKDPVFAEAVREAADLGYRFAPYEMRRDQRGPGGESQAESIVRREEAQANNLIENLLAPEPAARVIVFVGYGHINEIPDHNGGEWFAIRLARNAGLDPLTIGQTRLGAYGPHAPDAPLTQVVLERFAPTKPIVVRQGGAYLGDGRGTDISVLHPALSDVQGRPGWLAADPMRRFVSVDLANAAEGDVLAQAIHAHDPDPAVPADQFLLAPGARQADFLLRPGRYRVRLETIEGFRPLREIDVRA